MNNKASENQNFTVPVVLNGITIGKVYKLSDRWVAQPAWDIYSCSFLSCEQAVIELCLHYQAQQGPQLAQ